MGKKKICLVFNHFQYQDGVCRSAIAIANLLVKNRNVDVTLIPIYKFDKSVIMYLDAAVKVKPIFGFYFKGLSSLVDFIPNKLLYKFGIKEKYDIEIAFQFGTSTEFMAASDNKVALRLVWIHGYYIDDHYKQLYSKFDKVINVSACNVERLLKDTDGMISVDYCYNPIDDTLIRNQAKEPCSFIIPNRFTMVSVGRHGPEKGYSRLLDICYRLKQEGFLFQLVLIGTGPTHDKLIEKSKNLGLDNEVLFLGAKQNPHKYTIKADVFVCSSFSEGYSTACTEAIMLGIPVISTNVSGAEEIISESRVGILCEKDDDSLYSAIKYALENQNIVTSWKKKIDNRKFSQAYRSERLYNVLGL